MLNKTALLLGGFKKEDVILSATGGIAVRHLVLTNGKLSLNSQQDFSDLTKIGDPLAYAFYSSGLGGALSFPNLTNIIYGGLYSAFESCSFTSVSFPKLECIGGAGLSSAFANCYKLASVSFPALTTIESNGLSNAFENCALTSISFPALTTIGLYGLSNACKNCKKLTEIHFRADMSGNTQCSALNAPNATVYFDL